MSMEALHCRVLEGQLALASVVGGWNLWSRVQSGIGYTADNCTMVHCPSHKIGSLSPYVRRFLHLGKSGA